MDWWLACFFLGAIISLFSPIVPDLFVLLVLIILSFFFFYYPFYNHKPVKPLRLSSGLLFGVTWMLFNAANFQQLWQENNLNVDELSNNAQWIQGEIQSLHLPKNSTTTQVVNKIVVDKKLRFNMKVTHINDNQLKQVIQLRLSWKEPTLILQQGHIVRLKVKFKPSHGLANLGSFNYQTWLNSKKISATGYVINDSHNQWVNHHTTLRQKLFGDYKHLLPENDLSPLLLALGFGSRLELNPQIWQILQATGTGHLIAISGLHIGLIATGAFFVFTFITRALPLQFFARSFKLQSINYRYLAIGFSLLTALTYGYLAGFSLPTIRALVMLSLYWAIRLLGIKISVKRWLLLTLFFITITTPFSLFSASFWLSVYAVTIIFLTVWRFKRVIKSDNKYWQFIRGLLLIQLSLTLMLIPISAVFFQQISVVAFFANLIAVPWMSFLSIPLCLLSVLLMPISSALSQVFMMLCLESIQWLWYYLTYLSSQSWALIPLANMQVHILVLGGVIAVFFIFFQPKLSFRTKSILSISCCMLLIFYTLKLDKQPPDQPNHWQLVVFDVGQGLSLLIQRNNRAILYDTGASYGSGFNMVDAVVLPYLQYKGIKQLDKVIVSHSDNDHAGGLENLQQAIVINELIYNDAKQKLARVSTKKEPRNKATKHINLSEKDLTIKENMSVEQTNHCLQGNVFYWQGLKFEMLWPDTPVSEENDDSCVLLLSDKHHKVLLTGDISKSIERKLMQHYPQLSADVLVVPHHGSKTSSSTAFITQVNPKIALVSAGYLNRWQMPVAEVVNRYKVHNIDLINSAEYGQIIIEFSNKGMSQFSYREHLWPFWFANTTGY